MNLQQALALYEPRFVPPAPDGGDFVPDLEVEVDEVEGARPGWFGRRARVDLERLLLGDRSRLLRDSLRRGDEDPHPVEGHRNYPLVRRLVERGEDGTVEAEMARVDWEMSFTPRQIRRGTRGRNRVVVYESNGYRELRRELVMRFMVCRGTMSAYVDLVNHAHQFHRRQNQSKDACNCKDDPDLFIRHCVDAVKHAMVDDVAAEMRAAVAEAQYNMRDQRDFMINGVAKPGPWTRFTRWIGEKLDIGGSATIARD